MKKPYSVDSVLTPCCSEQYHHQRGVCTSKSQLILFQARVSPSFLKQACTSFVISTRWCFPADCCSPHRQPVQRVIGGCTTRLEVLPSLPAPASTPLPCSGALHGTPTSSSRLHLLLLRGSLTLTQLPVRGRAFLKGEQPCALAGRWSSPLRGVTVSSPFPAGLKGYYLDHL